MSESDFARYVDFLFAFTPWVALILLISMIWFLLWMRQPSTSAAWVDVPSSEPVARVPDKLILDVGKTLAEESRTMRQQEAAEVMP